MRKRSLLALAALMTTAVVAVTSPTPALAAPAGCSASASGIVLACDHAFPTVRPMGAIGLLGDSVLLGSSPGMSNPHLPALLGARQWGPIRMTTSLGMRTYNPVTTSASAFHVLGRWKAAGFNPRVIVVNLGANHFLDCNPTTFTVCQAKIVQLMDRIATQYPAATVWWAKTNARSLRTGAFDPGMLGWNKALDAVEKARPTKLVVWDWPKAIVDKKFVMDPPQIHPSSSTQYVKRSTAIADDVTARMPARFAPSGTNLPVTPPPSFLAAGLGFTVADPPVQTAPVAVGATPVRRAVGDVGAPAAALTITVHNAAAAGYVRAYDCDASSSIGTRLYFSAGQTRSVQAVSGLSGGDVCLAARVAPAVAVNVTVTTQGNFVQGSGSYLTPQATTNQQAAFAPGKIATVDVTADPTADAVAATLVVDATSTTAAGTLMVHACDQPAGDGVVELAYAKGEVVSGQVFAPVDASGQLCVRATTTATLLPKVFVRVSGRFSPGGLLAFRPVQTVRVLDLRVGFLKGGWVGRRFPGQDMVLASPAGARAASLVVTSYESTARGANVVWQRGPKPPTALFYFPAGIVPASNTVTVPVATNGYAIGDTTRTGIQRFAIDVAGWWVTAP